DPDLLARNVVGKAVLVTGAGGSIGGELARQILRLRPLKLVLLEIAEPALYAIEQQLQDMLSRRTDDGPVPEIVAVLGSVLDVGLVHGVLARHRIETIYHAAAYKHVPIVETNPAAGISNNTFGTRVLAEAARRTGVERFVLISTDKAVRPTSVMGASKRLAELVLQAHAAEPACETVFTMVRFGNVLDSSGSVVRLFRRQIEEGGPVTVTHPEVVRYFMSIPEAAALVIQAGAMAKGGDVFVLDMGEPIRIDTLARTMIRLMGLEVEDAETPEGDIAITYIGLRPGEKLYEELLIGERTTKTEHQRIARNHEPFRPLAEIERELESVRTAIQSGNLEAIHAVLQRTVEGYQPDRRLIGAEPVTKKAEETLH
ncbi:MAG: polysaccharide biosynthesis protein, partial [Hyphomicrobiaceae bacterium]